MEKTSIAERAETVSSFCTKNEIEYLTYHAPIIKESIYDHSHKQMSTTKKTLRDTEYYDSIILFETIMIPLIV